MAERSLDALPAHPEWFFQQTESGIAFVDPISGDQLSGMVWPAALEQDEIVRSGRNYLLQTAHPLHVIYASHGGGTDFERILRQPGEHHRYLGSAAVMALEMDWKPAYINNLSHPEAPNLTETVEWRRAFLEAEMAWARSASKLVLPFDIDGPSDLLRQGLLKLINYDVDPGVVPFPEVIPGEKRPQALEQLCEVAYNIFRHPMMFGQLGFGLRQLVEQGKITPDDQVVATLGPWHNPSFTDQALQLGYAGLLSVSEIEPREPDDASDKAARIRWHRGIVDAEISNTQLS